MTALGFSKVEIFGEYLLLLKIDQILVGKGISRNLPKKGGGVKYFKDKMEVKQKGGFKKKESKCLTFFTVLNTNLI